MKEKGLEICFIALIIVFITSVAFGQTAKPPIKMGGSLPLTGMFSEPAKWIKEGYDFWVEDINKRGGLLGRPVQMTIYDDESSPDKAVTYYERAISLDKVDLLVGGYPGTANVAVMPLVEKYEKVFVGMGGHLKSFEQGYTYTFGSPPLMSDWIYIALKGVLDDLIPKDKWPKSMAIFTMNNVIGLSAKPNVVKTAEEHGIKVVVDETYNLPLSDATPLVSKAKARGAEVLSCMSHFDDAVMFMRAAKAINYNPKLVFHLFAPTIPAWGKELGKDGDNVLTDMFWHPSFPYPDNKKISEAARARFKVPVAPVNFGFGYIWMKTLELAVQGADTLDNRVIRDYLRSHKFDLPYGKGITFDKRGLPPEYAAGLQCTGGQLELVWPKEVATTKFVYPRSPWGK